ETNLQFIQDSLGIFGEQARIKVAAIAILLVLLFQPITRTTLFHWHSNDPIQHQHSAALNCCLSQIAFERKAWWHHAELCTNKCGQVYCLGEASNVILG